MPLVLKLKQVFQSAKDSKNAKAQRAYMRDQFSFLGIKTTPRRILQREVFAKYIIESEKELLSYLNLLWKEQEREFQYAALDLAKKHIKLLTPKAMPKLLNLVCQKSWWDTVDDLAVNKIGYVMRQHRELLSYADQWIDHDNLWIRRTALICQLKWKKETDETRLFDYCAKTMHEKEFFIRKALGWSLREYAKTNRKSVQSFVKLNRDNMSGLSVREATKHF